MPGSVPGEEKLLQEVCVPGVLYDCLQGKKRLRDGERRHVRRFSDFSGTDTISNVTVEKKSGRHHVHQQEESPLSLCCTWLRACNFIPMLNKRSRTRMIICQRTLSFYLFQLTCSSDITADRARLLSFYLTNLLMCLLTKTARRKSKCQVGKEC